MKPSHRNRIKQLLGVKQCDTFVAKELPTRNIATVFSQSKTYYSLTRPFEIKKSNDYDVKRYQNSKAFDMITATKRIALTIE